MIFVGDLHGGYPALLDNIGKKRITDESIIQVGDWGLGFAPLTDDLKALKRVDDFLRERDVTLYIIRGNHDNKWYWDNAPKFGLKHVHLVKDYDTRIIDEQRLLFIGGGISIDRNTRKLNKDYWPNEIFKLNEQLVQNICSHRVDIIVSHIAPKSCWPYKFTPLVEYYIEQERNAGRDLRAALLAERKQMETVLHHVKTAGVKEWYYGHYHESVTEQIGNITFRCLDIGELYHRS